MLSYTGQSWSAVHRETFVWQKSGTTVREALVFILSRGWHRLEMSTTPEGAKKGCRHHFQASVRPLSMKYQYISIEICAIGVAGTAPKVQGVAA